MLEGQSRALKTRMIAWFPKNFWVKTMTRWVGA